MLSGASAVCSSMNAIASVARPAERVHPRVDDEPAGAPAVERGDPDPVEVARVEPHLVAQPLGVQAPALEERGRPGVPPEGRQVGELLARSRAGDDGRGSTRGRRAPRPRSVAASRARTCSGSSGRAGCRPRPAGGSRRSSSASPRGRPSRRPRRRPAGSDPEPVRDRRRRPVERRRGRSRTPRPGRPKWRLGSPRSRSRAAAGPRGPERPRRPAPELGVDPLDLGQADRVDLLGAQVERGVGPDEPPVGVGAAGHDAEAGPVVRARPREDPLGDQVSR